MNLQTQAFAQSTDRGFGSAIYGSTGREHLDAEDRGGIDEVAAFLLQKVRQCGRNAVEHALDVEVDHAIPLVDLEKRKRRDRHDAGIVHQDVDLAIGVDGLVDQGLDFGPLRWGYGYSERLFTGAPVLS